MTDMEMDLVLAKAEIEILKKELSDKKDMVANQRTHIASLQTAIEDLRKQMPMKCSYGVGVSIKPDGVNELDPCSYEILEAHRNVTVEILRCKKCGHIEILWHRQEDTEDGDFDG